MRKFKLKKELPGCKVGTIGQLYEFDTVYGGAYKAVYFEYKASKGGAKYTTSHNFSLDAILSSPDFFEEVIEQKAMWTDDDLIEFASEAFSRSCKHDWSGLRHFLLEFKVKNKIDK